MKEVPLLIASFSNLHENVPNSAVVTWEELTRRLTRHREREETDGELWSPTFYPPDTQQCTDDNVIQLTCFVIDCDDGTPPERLEHLWEPYAYLLHSTHRHTAAAPRWRAVFPLASYVWAADWRRVWARLMDALAPGNIADPQCKNEGRRYFTPAYKPGDEDRFVRVHEGKRLNPHDFEPAAPPPLPAALVTPRTPLPPEAPRVPGERVPAARLMERALQTIVLEKHPDLGQGRHAGTKWLFCQLRDNGYSSEEARQLGDEWLALLPPEDTKGDSVPFPPDELTSLWAWAYSQPARSPWTTPEPIPEPPEELAPPERRRIPGSDVIVIAEAFDAPLETAEADPTQETSSDLGTPADDDLRERTGEEILAGVYTAAQLQTQEIPPLVYTVDEVLPEGLTMIHGHSKLGKSFLGMDIAAGIALGGRVFGRFQAQRGRVLYLAMEDGPRRLKTRFQALFTDLGVWPDTLHLVHDWKTMDARGFLLLKGWLATHPDTKAIILDPWTALRPTHSRGGDIVIEDRKPLERLDRLGHKHHLSFLVLHHSAQHNKGDSLNNASGSSGVVQPATSVLEFSRKRGEHEAVLKGSPKDGPEIDWTLKRDERTGFWTAVGDTEEFQTSAARAEILALLTSDGPMAPRVIAAALERNEGTIGKLCRRMRDDGLLRGDRGSYSVS